MTYDKPLTTMAERIAFLSALEGVDPGGPRPPPTPKADPVVDARMAELERLAAADLVMLLRHANETAATRDELGRARLADAGRRLAAELLAGCQQLERYRPSNDTPEYLREGSTVPLRALESA